MELSLIEFNALPPDLLIQLVSLDFTIADLKCGENLGILGFFDLEFFFSYKVRENFLDLVLLKHLHLRLDPVAIRVQGL